MKIPAWKQHLVDRFRESPENNSTQRSDELMLERDPTLKRVVHGLEGRHREHEVLAQRDWASIKRLAGNGSVASQER